MKIFGKTTTAALSLLLLVGCAVTRHDSDLGENEIAVNELHFKTWNSAVAKCVDSLLKTPELNNGKGDKPVILFSKPENSTKSVVNLKLLSQAARLAILRSGKAVTTDVAAAKPLKDAEGRGRGGLSPKFSLSIEVTNINKSDGKEMAIDDQLFAIHMTLLDIDTGAPVWEEAVDIPKINDAHADGR